MSNPILVVNSPQPEKPPLSGAPLSSGAAVLVLDAGGRVELANQAACALWQAAELELVGDSLPNLFIFDVTSREPDWLQAQWEVLLAAAETQPLALQLQPKESAAFEVQLRLEKASQHPARYFAMLGRPAPAVAPAAVAPQDNLLSLLHERSPLGFFDLNFQKNEIYFSPAWKRQLGYAPDALANTYDTWHALVHPEDTGAAPDRQTRGATVGTRPFSLEFRMKHAHGRYVWVQSVGVQSYGPNGALQRVLGAHLDIQDRKEFEEAGLRAEERLQMLGDRGKLGVFDFDFLAGQAWLSPALKALLGYAATELPDSAESLLRALPMEETTGGLPAYFLTKHPGRTAYFDTLHLRHRDGHTLVVQAGVMRVISRKKELQRVLGFLLPMPEGVATAPDTGLPAAHLGVLLAEMREAVLIADGTGRVIFVNAKAEQLLGRTAEAVLAQHAADVFRLVHRTSGQPGENPVDRALSTAEPMALNNEFALDTGAPRRAPVTFSSRAVFDSAGRAAGAVVVFRNPDEMGLTPEELLRANRFDSLGQLAGGIAHDFNNLLTTILGGVSLAKDNRDDSGLENSERACLAAKALSKQLLTFAKGGTAVRQVVKPAEFLSDAVRLSAAGSAVKVELAAPANLGTVCVDRAQILQVFQNLIINAIQAMPTGRGHVWVSAADVTLADAQIAPLAAGRYVAVEVRDDGAGIPAESLQKIFAPFYTTKKHGTGLGLATVRSIVTQHGGQIGVESELGRGTAFTVFLPFANAEIEVEARSAPSLRFGTGRILFMDDDPHICHLTGTMLESLGYKFDLAKNGEEAVQFYKRYLNIGRPYDLVIMDLTIIGGMGGEQAFKLLKDLDPDLRAIITSGYDNDEMARQYMEMGFFGYLTKPYRVGDLGRHIKKVLGK
ncbi:MAG: PAS domain-containing protein [Opitutae bacterium]|nr:PAS domain-containing protein [Opitutae bacterium]